MAYEVPNSKAHWFVSHIIRNGKWDLDDIKYLLPDHLIESILAYPIPKHSEEEDFIRWNYSKYRAFTIKSTYHLLLSQSLSSNSNWFSWKSL